MITRRETGAGKAVTLRDVARLAEVDSSIVSRVLRGADNVSVREETRERIVALARELGYSPNPAARALRTARAGSLALVVPQLESPVFQQIAASAERAADGRGYALVIYHVQAGDPRREREKLTGLLRSIRVDGVIVATLQMADDADGFFGGLSLPWVLVNRDAPGVRNCISLDDEGGARLATEHLLALGHKRVAHVGGPQGRFNAVRRRAGYRAALEAAGLAADESCEVAVEYTVEGGRRGMTELLGRAAEPPTAVFAATLLSAIGSLQAIRAAGLSAPDDISLITLYDAPLAEFVTPRLTVVGYPVDRMARLAVESLTDRIAGTSEDHRRQLPPLGIIERESCVRLTNKTGSASRRDKRQ